MNAEPTIGAKRITAGQEFRNLIESLKRLKPGDRSEQDRWYQIVITDVEKAFGVYQSQIGEGKQG